MTMTHAFDNPFFRNQQIKNYAD